MMHLFSCRCTCSPVVFVLFLVLASACSRGPEKPPVDSESYKQVVSDFYVSLAAVQSDEALFASEKMQQVAEAYPSEPAAWANLAVYALRQGNFELATQRMEKALKRSSDNADILFLAGILESQKGNIEASLDYLREAAELAPSNLKILFALAEELERQDPDANAPRIAELMDQILEKDPANLAVLLEVVRTAARRGDGEAVEKALENIGRQSDDWPEQNARQFQEQKAAILDKKGENISFELAFLRNNLNQLASYRHDLRKVEFPPNQIAFLLTEFYWLPSAEYAAAPKDSGITFAAAGTSGEGSLQLYKPIGLANQQRASTVAVSGNTAIVNDRHRLAFPGNEEDGRLSPDAVTAIDYNYDFLNDLAFAGSEGFRFYRQREDSTFAEVTGSLELPPSVVNDAYVGSWSRDLDLDGDLDLLLSAKDGESLVLRNNGNGTFSVRRLFEETSGIRDFLWADFDLDGDSDAVLLTDEGEVHYYSNERAGEFEARTDFVISEPATAVDFGDLNSDGVFEIVSLHSDRIISSSYADSTGSWQQKELVAGYEGDESAASQSRLFIADLDNNGALDLLTSDGSATRYWLSGSDLKLGQESYRLDTIQVFGLSDFNNNTRLDMLGLDTENRRATLLNEGSKEYNARIISPRASGTEGDQRINSFGIGGEIESRSGLQYLKQPIQEPWVHIGLGTYDEAEMLRIIWPNGSVQAEFAELGYDAQIENEQILKGSCPWVLTYNGEEMEFVTDFLWRTALGLKINAQGEANVIHSIDWIKIDGDQLKPRDGYYEVRITADLWETHFFDHVSLMAVDHPENTEVFVDERFTLPAPEQKLYPMEQTYPVASAVDQDGNVVTDRIAERDGTYLNSFELTPYQGLAEEHFVEVRLGEEVPANGKLKLLASGWIYPTDTSINIALSQGNYEPPHGVKVTVPDASGGWKVVHPNLGFPAGKSKTMLVDLEDAFEPGTERRVRLYTNMEIYWDQIRVGLQNDDMEMKVRELDAEVANLRYRGYSELVQKERFLPTKPNYRQISGTTPKWRDLVGFYTRFGEVNELTKKIDDRYVIMNAGDELVFKFPVPESPREGWTRDFVLVGDGWVKDGDYNTGHSKTVLPLPYHGMEDYSEEPGLLQEDPVYKKHKQDWVKYHTRYITPHNFNTALKFKK